MRVMFLKTLVFCDEPQLILSTTDRGRDALALAVPDERPGYTYLVVEASKRRLNNVLKGATTLRQAFKFPEYWSWHVLYYPPEPISDYGWWATELTHDRREDWLPGKGLRL